MSTSIPAEFPLPRPLPDGLILRRSSAADADQLAEFNQRIHTADDDEPDTHDSLAAWTRDLLNGQHPTHAPDDFTLVVEESTGKIVSAMNLISQTWAFDGLPLGVGRPELVGTDPAYRNRGLVRTQFDVIHAWSRQRGHLLQGITGIPYFYRQFGYEMTVEMPGRLFRRGKSPSLDLKPGETDPYTMRPAVEADLPFIAECEAAGTRAQPLTVLRDLDLWRYELNGRSQFNIHRSEIRLITTAAGAPVGFLAHAPLIWGNAMLLSQLHLTPGVSWQAVMPSVLRYQWAVARQHMDQNGGEVESVGVWMCRDHPAYPVVKSFLPETGIPYAWYLRVPDLPAFLRHIAPALAARLAASPLAGHTGEMRLCFYRSGLYLKFEQGQLTQVQAEPVAWHKADAAFPDQTFLHLLFGHRSVSDLRYMFGDFFVNSSHLPLLEALFPPRAAYLWPIS